MLSTLLRACRRRSLLLGLPLSLATPQARGLALGGTAAFVCASRLRSTRVSSSCCSLSWTGVGQSICTGHLLGFVRHRRAIGWLGFSWSSALSAAMARAGGMDAMLPADLSVGMRIFLQYEGDELWHERLLVEPVVSP